jgi:hypothetical protein
MMQRAAAREITLLRTSSPLGDGCPPASAISRVAPHAAAHERALGGRRNDAPG